MSDPSSDTGADRGVPGSQITRGQSCSSGIAGAGLGAAALLGCCVGHALIVGGVAATALAWFGLPAMVLGIVLLTLWRGRRQAREEAPLADGEVDRHLSRDRRPPQEARQTQRPARIEGEDHQDTDEAQQRLVAEATPPPENGQRQEAETDQVTHDTPSQIRMPAGDVQAAGHDDGHAGGDQLGSVEPDMGRRHRHPEATVG
jgi:hypothetical protein